MRPVPPASRLAWCGHAIILAGMLAAAPVTAAQGAGPREAVEELEAALIEVMKASAELGFRGRFEKLEPIIGRVYDLPYIARLVLGPEWEKLDAARQETFVAVFSRLVVATFAGELGPYEGQRFKHESQRSLRNERVLVRSQFVETDGDVDRFDYVLRPGKSGWRVINVVVDGVSDLALKRAEYTAVLARSGFETLVTELESKVAQYADR